MVRLLLTPLLMPLLMVVLSGMGVPGCIGDLGTDSVAWSCWKDDQCAEGFVCQDVGGNSLCVLLNCGEGNPNQGLGMSEVCDGIDNDCDGLTDEGLTFGGQKIGETCPAVGVCSAGVVECVGGAAGCSTHLGGSAATTVGEVCDGLDNDCDGVTDNFTNPPVVDGAKGVCAGLAQVCMGALGWQDPGFAGVPFYEADETTCDGRDNDCDGEVDEGLGAGAYCAGQKANCSADSCCTSHGTCENQAKNEAYVAVGTFWFGCNPVLDNACETDETPSYQASLSAYYVDLTEVTVTAYEQCVTAGVCTAPTEKFLSWEVEGEGNYPVNGLFWSQASQYCAWVGKALCTEAQWENAARGGCLTQPLGVECSAFNRVYPWGQASPTCERAVMNETQDDADDGCGAGQAIAVGQKPDGRSPYGVLDMAGNVWEYTADFYFSSHNSNDKTDPKGPDSGDFYVIRGGGYTADAATMRASNRLGLAPDAPFNDVGFRCCRAVQ